MSLETELTAILTTAAIAPITDRGFLRITGPDATRWLNGMVTNNIKDLAPGEGNYNFLLNAQGRIQGDCTIYREPFVAPTFVLQTDATQLETIHQLLDKFIIMDDVELTTGLKVEGTTVEKSPRGLTLVGPRAADILLKTIVARDRITSFITPPEQATITPGSLDICDVVILTPPNVSKTYEVWSSSTRAIKELYRVWEFYGANPISPETLEAHRILFGTPRYGTDIRNTDTAKDLPQETAQTHALNFNKGCYLGQEIVERIHSRGQVHRTFARFELKSTSESQDLIALPTLPCQLTLDGKSVGELTSAALIPLASGPTLQALGYIRSEAATATLTYPGGTATVLPTTTLSS